MRRENSRRVFTFDRHFPAAGFRLWPDEIDSKAISDLARRPSGLLK
jgi:hypothetical protein